MFPKRFAAACAVFSCACAFAQFGGTVDPDWREADVPPPPALKTTGLVELEIPRSALRFGVDPDSVSIGKDGIVRYVVVARSNSGVVNGIYEGINCNGGQVKVYARHNPDRGWVPVQDEKWGPIHDSGLHQTYTLLIARQGACIGQGPNQSAKSVVRDLRANDDTRFRNEAHH